MANCLRLTESHLLPIDQFVVPKHYSNDISSILIPPGLIQDRIEKLACDIVASLPNELSPTNPLVCLCILKGSQVFYSNLLKTLAKKIPIQFEFCKVKSYINDQSSGNVQISLTEDEILGMIDKNILVIEDIVDTGSTITKLIAHIKSFNPKTISVCSLLLKRTTKTNGFVPDFVGFSIPDLFVVGYGLDYNQVFRDLEPISVISEEGKMKYSA